ncbi:MAG: DNA polymerase I [Bacteroidetes bacterium]|nr:DNA polymerase I [Bacteroidota bacterium]
MSEKKLFLLDGMALVYRAYFAFQQNPRITSFGLNASAMFGFTNTLLDVLNKQKPTHIAVVFDTSAPTQRHIDYEAYKAHREEMPEDLKRSLPYINRIIEGFNIPVITKDGFEADDIIGTLALQAGELGFEVYMMTPDKDYGQLVRKNVYIYKPGRLGNPDEILGEKEILQKWEVENVHQVIDILGLWGDAVDNIPGVPGVGEKTAKKLIAEFGSIENILQNTDSLQGKMKEKFEQNSEQALMSKKLATILIDVPVELHPEDLIVKEKDPEKLNEVFKELEFRTISKRVFGEPETQPVQASLFDAPATATFSNASDSEPTHREYKTISNTKHEYFAVQSEEEIQSLLKRLNEAKEFCFDTETTGLVAFDADIVGMSFSVKAGEAYYVPCPSDYQSSKKLIERFKDIFTSDKLKIAQNLKYDLQVLGRYGQEVSPPYFDTMLAHYLVEPDMRHNMDVLSEAYLNYQPVSIEELIGKKGKNQGSMADVPLEQIKEYAAEDADITYQLKQKMDAELQNRNVQKVFEDIEIPLVPVLCEMEKEGVKIDIDFLGKYSEDLSGQSEEIQKEIFKMAGGEFNISSPQQVGKILFDHLKLIEKPKKTKTGQYQTDEDTLTELAAEHEIVRRILDYRQIQKLIGTYVDALPQLVNPNTGRVHTSFNQAVAATGRLSSNNPNLQNIPIRTERGQEVRRAFVPRDNQHLLLSADYSQIELRIIAHVSKDEGMMEAFRENLDIHTATAARVWSLPLNEVDKEMRRRAKTVNFGIIYGISAFGLSQRIGIPRGEAREIIDNYFAKFPGIKDYMDTTQEFARKHGYVETIMGRRRYIRDINSKNATVRGFAERNAINAPIQGSAADMIKMAMIDIHHWLKNSDFQTKMILQVHDELLFDVPKNEVEKVKPEIIKLMANAMQLEVPVLVEAGVGASWLEAH